MTKFIFAIAVAGLASTISVARADDTPPVDAVNYSDVKPILMKRCSSCHNHEDAAMPNWLVYDNAYRFRELINRYTVVGRSMPPFRNLTGMTDDERAKLGAWIAAGAPSGDLPPLQPTVKTSFFRDVLPIFGRRCSMCHNDPKDTRVLNWLDYDTASHNTHLIWKRAVQSKEMPPQNITQMTLEERDRIRLWIDQGAQR